MVVSKTLWLPVIVTLRQDLRDRLTTSGEPCLAIVPKETGEAWGLPRSMGSWAESAKFVVREAGAMVGGSQSGP
jgi:hypothetical protein